jgi:flagellar L-ring protein precursor FlgH
MPARWAVLVTCGLAVSGCGTLTRLSELGRAPEMSKASDPTKDPNYRPMSMPMPKTETAPNEANALWRQGSRAFFKDQRAANVGDLVTIVVSMTDSAVLNNVTTLSRASGEAAGIPDFAGLTSRLGTRIADPSKLISLSSSNNNTGNGQIQRNEAVTLRLAGVVTQVLPNGNLVVAARQEFVVNSELRELRVAGVIRPQDIASDNTVLHDRMAEARIQYGGRGQMTDLQSTRWGQQLMDILLPF